MKNLNELIKETLLLNYFEDSIYLANRYGEVLEELKEFLTTNGDCNDEDIKNHPINILWVAKISSIAGMENYPVKYQQAYNWCYDEHLTFK